MLPYQNPEGPLKMLIIRLSVLELKTLFKMASYGLDTGVHYMPRLLLLLIPVTFYLVKVDPAFNLLLNNIGHSYSLFKLITNT